MGIDTLMVGPLPTPGVAFITRAYRADAGVAVSASPTIAIMTMESSFFLQKALSFPTPGKMRWRNLYRTGILNDCLPNNQDIGKNTKIHDADRSVY